jgi:hypothetical protein
MEFVVYIAGMHIYELKPGKDGRGFYLISEALPFGRLWFQDADAAIGFATFYSQSKRGEVCIFDAAGSLLYVRSWAGNFKEA